MNFVLLNNIEEKNREEENREEKNREEKNTKWSVLSKKPSLARLF